MRFDVAAGQLDWRDLEAALAERPKLLAIGAASNALGTINDVARAAQLAHQQGALVFVDAVHYAPHQLVDVAALGADLLVCSAYKFYGPHVGVLWGRAGPAREPRRSEARAGSGEPSRPARDGHPEPRGHRRARPPRSTSWPRSLPAPIGARACGPPSPISTPAGSDSFEQLWNGLSEIDGVRLYGPTPRQPRTPTVAFTVAGVAAEEVARRLVGHGVFVSNGDFYATTVVRRLGLAEQGLVRAGCACYTTGDEIRRLVEGVATVAKTAR